MFDTLTRLGASAAGDYEIERSVRHNSASTTYFDRTPSSTSNRTTFTFSVWVKFTTPGSSTTPSGAIFGVWQDNTSRDTLRFESGNINLQCGQHSENATTTALFRDPSAWYHIVCAVDSTQAASGDRVVIYVNGVSQALGTNTISQNREFKINTDNKHVIGCRWLSDAYHLGFNGYIAEFNFIDGSKLAASSFGETNADTGQWIPKKYAGSYGTNGYYLKFDDNSGTTATTLGKDSSGNGNNFTPNNYSIAAAPANDSVTDTPTNNFCTLNPLYINSGNWPSHGLLYGGKADTAGWRHRLSTMSLPATGKWYWEIKIPNSAADASNGYMTGIGYPPTFTSMQDVNSNSTGMYGRQGTEKYLNDSSNPVDSDFTSVSNNDILQYAYDADNQKLYTGKNNTWEESANPSTGANPNWTSVASGGFPLVGSYGNNLHGIVNFGQQGFIYTPPTGYNTLSTANLPTPTIEKPNKHFGIITYTGDGGSDRTVSDSSAVDFTPDFVWIKNRDDTDWHMLQDVVRGANKVLYSNTNDGEDTDNTNGHVNSFVANGFTVDAGASGNTNKNTEDYVSWNWKGGGSASSNSNGTITSSVSVNATAGFSIVTWSGTGSAGTIGHGLGVAPKWLVVKRRTGGAQDWFANNGMIMNDYGKYFKWNEDASSASDTNVFPNTAPTSTVFSVGNDGAVNASGSTYVAYVFSEVAGYSKISSYEGLGGTNGPFVNVGFRPSFVMIKNVDSGSRWWVLKTSKIHGYNPQNEALAVNNNNAEASESSIDILSNGFKIRNNGSYTNENNSTHMYMAFSENPFKYANAR